MLLWKLPAKMDSRRANLEEEELPRKKAAESEGRTHPEKDSL